MKQARQELLWMPKGVDVGAFALKCSTKYSGLEPDRLWTLFLHTDQESPPTLPFKAHHGQNAFIEDKMHDWNVQKGFLNYFSRVSEGGSWLLLEFNE